MEAQMIYQFCLANYSTEKEFLIRIKRFLKVFKKGLGVIEDPLMPESTFKDLHDNTMILVDIIPPLFIPTIHEFDLSPYFEYDEIYPLVEEVIRDLENTKPFDPKFLENNESTIVIKFNHRVRLLPDFICQKDL